MTLAAGPVRTNGVSAEEPRIRRRVDGPVHAALRVLVEADAGGIFATSFSRLCRLPARRRRARARRGSPALRARRGALVERLLDAVPPGGGRGPRELNPATPPAAPVRTQIPSCRAGGCGTAEVSSHTGHTQRKDKHSANTSCVQDVIIYI